MTNSNPIPNHQNQGHSEYSHLQNNYKTEFSHGNVSSTPCNTQWTANYSNSLPLPNSIAPNTTNVSTSKNSLLPNTPAVPTSKPANSSENSTYKDWKLKFSSKDSNGFHCLVCQGKSFTADSSLKRHYKQVHEQTCKTCKMQFSEECILNQHIKDNHEFRCNICFKVFSANSSLKRHHDQQHGGAMPNQGQQTLQLGFQGTAHFAIDNKVSFNIMLSYADCAFS